jgi:hypothetical protein
MNKDRPRKSQYLPKFSFAGSTNSGQASDTPGYDGIGSWAFGGRN